MSDRPDPPDDLERLASQPQPGLIAEFLGFLGETKKWWMVPILVMIGVFGLLVVLAGTGVAPFIYTLF